MLEFERAAVDPLWPGWFDGFRATLHDVARDATRWARVDTSRRFREDWGRRARRSRPTPDVSAQFGGELQVRGRLGPLDSLAVGDDARGGITDGL